LKNSLNDLLIKTDEAKNINLKGTNHSIEISTTIATAFIIVIVLYSVLILQSLLIKFIRQYRNESTKLFEQLSRFSGRDEIITERIENSKALAQIMLDEENLTKMQKNWTKAKMDIKTKVKLDKKTIHYRGLFIPIFKKWALLTISMSIIILLFTLLSLRASQFKNVNAKNVEKYTYALDEMNTLGIGLTALYEYVSEDGTTTIRNKPIIEALDTALARIKDLNSLYRVYAQSDNNFELDPAYTKIFQGYLCDWAVPAFLSICLTDTTLNSKGLFGLKTFYSGTIEKLKIFYSNSNKTYEAKYEAFSDNDLVMAERRLYIYTRPAYQQLEKQLKKEMFDYLDEFKHRNLIFSLLVILSVNLLIIIIWKPIFTRLAKKYDKLKGVLRIIPIELLRTHKGLISFIKFVSPSTIGTKTIDIVF